MIKKIIQISSLAVLVLAILGCESRMVNAPVDVPTVRLSIDVSGFSPKLLAKINQYQVSVVDKSVPETLTVTPLALDSTGHVVGLIDSLPAEISLEFTAEALDSLGKVVFRGTTNTILDPETVNNVLIDLSPVLPLLKSTPRYSTVIGSDTLTTHKIDIKIFSVDSLYGISFRVRYNPNYLIMGNATLDTSLNAASVIFFQFDSSDGLGPYKAIAVTNTVPNSSIVDANGDAVLANIRFALVRPFTAPDSTFITLEPTGLTKQDQTIIPTSVLYVDETVVKIVP